MAEGLKAWVLWHQYSDKSSASVERVYLDKARAEQDHALVMAADKFGGSGDWQLAEVDLVGEVPRPKRVRGPDRAPRKKPVTP